MAKKWTVEPNRPRNSIAFGFVHSVCPFVRRERSPVKLLYCLAADRPRLNCIIESTTVAFI